MKILKLSTVIVLLAVLFFSCQKEYSFEMAITPAGTWEFNDSTKQYTGNIDTAYIQATGTTKTMSLVGRTIDGKQNFLLHLYATDSFKVGSYKASLYQTDFQYFTTAKNIYQADQFIGEFIVVVTALANNQITGTFSGTSQDSSGAIKPLTLGKFTSRINLSGNGTGGGSTATGTLGASTGTCTPTSSAGPYTQGVPLTSGNTITVTVTVTTPGTYTIATNTVNGVSFSKTGTFTTTGVQTVVLNGTGTPINSGNQTFIVTFGSSTCNFPINFGVGTPPPTGDYFPTTLNSNWTYGLEGGTPLDSLNDLVINYNPVFSGKTYSTITEELYPVTGNPDDSSYFRKPGGDYYGYITFPFDTPVSNEYIFLKDNVAAPATWQSPPFSGNISGTPATITIKMTLLAKNVNATSGSVTSDNVIKVKYEYFVNLQPLTPFFIEERWFAKGIGKIYQSYNSGTKTDIYHVGKVVVF